LQSRFVAILDRVSVYAGPLLNHFANYPPALHSALSIKAFRFTRINEPFPE
jgi:hypothetical protein